MSFLIAFQNLLFKDLFSFLTKRSALSATWILTVKKSMLIYYVKGGLHERIFMKINTVLKRMLYQQYSFVYTEREFSKSNTFGVLFLLFLYSCQGELIQISLNSPPQEYENKRILFWKFKDEKVILKKKANLQEMYVRDFRVTIPACKINKINTNALKIIFLLLILFFSVFRPSGLFRSCSLTAKFSSVYTAVLLSYI